MSGRTRIGIDLGGTKVEAVALREAEDGSLDVLARRRVPTPRAQGYEAIVEATASLAEALAAELALDPARAPMGVGMPGSVTAAGLVKNSNTVCLNGRPFAGDLERRLGRPLRFDNDANCFALAETRFGAAAAFQGGIVLGVILGTGVGGGIVVRGEIWSGGQGIAGEWGHHAVFHGRGPACYCGRTGCLELFASGPAIEADYARRSGSDRPLADIAARRGRDLHADAAIEGLLEAFGRGLANVIDVLDPSAVVLGGGVSNLHALYDEGVRRVAGYVFNEELTTPIVRHALGDSAGVIGAALLGQAREDDG